MFKYKVTVITDNHTLVISFVRDTYLSESEFTDYIRRLLHRKKIDDVYKIPSYLQFYLGQLFFKLERYEFIPPNCSMGDEIVLDIKINMEF